MILADTSIWIDHLRQSDATVAELIRDSQLLVHPFVMGELTLGSMADRHQTLGMIGRLPTVLPARHGEVMKLVDDHRLHGRGIGWVDTHLLCSAKLRPGTRLWTRDRRLREAAETLGLAASL